MPPLVLTDQRDGMRYMVRADRTDLFTAALQPTRR
jgi:hypothetical protein